MYHAAGMFANGLLSSGPVLEAVKAWANAGLALIYPEICQICGEKRATPGESYICAGCRGTTRFVEPPFCQTCGRPVQGDITTSFECSACRETSPAFSHARSAVLAGETVLDVIHRYKYSRAMWFEGFLAELLIERAKPELKKEKWDFLVPVPLHSVRQREREFNQAERLARRLSRATGIPMNRGLIRRKLPTPSQTTLSREERAENVRNAFVLRGGVRLDGERLVVVDDVFTTGATTGACARVLRKAGASAVCVWTVARGA
jgi:ComF family protein